MNRSKNLVASLSLPLLLAASLLATKADGRVKLYLTHRALDCRRRRPTLFAEGAYVPLEGRGARAEHVVAFGRARDDDAAIAVAPRFLARLHLAGPPLGPVWAGTWIPLPPAWASQAFLDALTGEVVVPTTREGQPVLPLDTVLARVPVALLEATDERRSDPAAGSSPPPQEA